jgi:hypothetical protein
MVDEMSGAIQYTSRIGSRLGAPLRVMREPPARSKEGTGAAANNSTTAAC